MPRIYRYVSMNGYASMQKPGGSGTISVAAAPPIFDDQFTGTGNLDGRVTDSITWTKLVGTDPDCTIGSGVCTWNRTTLRNEHKLLMPSQPRTLETETIYGGINRIVDVAMRHDGLGVTTGDSLRFRAKSNTMDATLIDLSIWRVDSGANTNITSGGTQSFSIGARSITTDQFKITAVDDGTQTGMSITLSHAVDGVIGTVTGDIGAGNPYATNKNVYLGANVTGVTFDYFTVYDY